MRASFGRALTEIGNEVPEVFVLDADCATSTTTQGFADLFPDRFANVGIAEQNMVGVAAGLALVGWRPIVNSFAAMLVHRAHEQLMQSIALPRADVIVVGHYAGLSAGVEGAPHHSISDVSLMRAVPGMEVWWPFDDKSTAATTSRLISSGDGPRYLRLERNSVAACPPPDLDDDTVHVWGPGGRVAVVAAGGVVGSCIEAAAGCDDVRVIAVTRVAPLDREKVASALAGVEVVISVEEHRGVGGLTSALLDSGVLSDRRLVRLALDGFTETGTPGDLRNLYGVDAVAIAREIESELSRSLACPMRGASWTVT